MRFELDRFTEGFFFMLFDTPDRVQHMLWRFRDREHPGFEPDLSPEFSTRIEEHYRRCDALLSSVLDKVDENTLLIVLSDHGFEFLPRFRHQHMAMAERIARPQRQWQAGRRSR